MLDTLILLAAATAEAGQESGLSAMAHQFGIEWKIIVAQAVNFCFVAFLLWKFAFKPVMATLDERQRKIAEGLQFAEESKTQLAETWRRRAGVLREANAKAQEILHETREKAQQFEDKMKAETAVQIEDMRKRAEDANELERKKMLQDVRSEIARLVVMTSGKVLQRELADEEKSRLDKAAAREISQLN